jgi:hypothetical protein
VISLASARPFVGGVRRQVSFADRQAAAGSGEPQASVVFVGSRYFEALQVPVVRGRYFRAGDVAPGQQAAVVNQRFVDVFYPNDDPIGRPIRLSDPEEDAASPWLTIVGVAPSIRQSIAAGTRPVVYLPFATHAGPRASIIVGGVSDAAGIVPGLRREIAGLDAAVTLFNVRPLAELLDDSRLQPRLLGTVIAVFALIALLLSVLGLHAFTAYGVQQRTHEIGVRMALGARSEQVVRLFVRMAMMPLGIGILIGMPGALGVGRLLQGLLIQTSPTDPATLIAITVLLVSVSAAACFFPARRAARLDPLRALRND